MDLVKAFLRDSDSDCEDAYFLQHSSGHASLGGAHGPIAFQDEWCPLSSAPSKGGKQETGLGSSTCRANSSSLLHLSSRMEVSSIPESGSPHSQGHSSLTTFQSTVSETGGQDDQSFHSVLSFASTSTVFDIESVEDCSDKKRKATWPVMGHPEKKTSTPAESVSSVVTTIAETSPTPTPPPALAPLVAAKQCHRETSVGKGLAPLGGFIGGSISTGVPVDTLVAPTTGPSPLPFARSPPPMAAYSAAWPAFQAPLPGKGTGAVQTPAWHPPQAMIPTTAPMPAHCVATARGTPPPPATTTTAVSTQKITAALAELSKLPLGAGPLGLKLDKVGATNMLRNMGMKKLGGF